VATERDYASVSGGLYGAIDVLARKVTGIASVTSSFELRIAKRDWRMQLGDRFYQQSRADFFASARSSSSA
jgi:hypothetical protein